MVHDAAGTGLGKKCTDALCFWRNILVILDRPSKPTLGGVVLFLAAKKEVFANGSRLFVVGFDPRSIVTVSIIIVLVVPKTVVPPILSTVGRKGSLDLFQSRGYPAKTERRLEFLQGPRFLNIFFGRINSGTVHMVWICLFLFVAALFLLWTLLNPVALDVAQLAGVSIGRNAQFFGFVGAN